MKADFGDGATVAGRFAFIKSYNAEDGSFELYASESEISAELNIVGRKLFKYVYTPVDSFNYNAFIGDVELLINAQNAKTGNGSLGVEFGIGAIQFYLVNQTISTVGLDVYRIYDSYYQENGVTYGMREQLNAGSVSFTVSTASGATTAHGYRITASDVKDGVITLTATVAGGYNGTIRIPVTEKQPKKLTISSESVYQTVWYVGQTFDYSGMLFDVTYDDDTFAQGLTQGAITSDYDNVKFDSTHVGTVVVTFKFFGQTVSLEFTVKEKEDLQLSTDTTKTIKLAYKDGAEIPAPVLKFLVDGKEVTEIEGVQYAVSVIGGNGKLSERGEYTLRYSFTVTNPRFNNLMTVSLKVVVTDIPYNCDYELPTSEQLNKEYTGEAFVLPEAVISNVRDLEGNPVSMNHVEIVYTVNGEVYKSGMLVNVGSYKVEVTVYVNNVEILTESYVFVITRAEEYSVVVTINNIKFGGELKPEVTSAFGADRVVYEYNTTDGAAGWSSEDVPKKVGVYYVRAYIPDDVNGNYGRAYSEAVRFEIRQGEIVGDVNENGEELG
ncbi:MAG: hypothetical protein K2L72_01775, partial [Clostridia bacterium]|nr:hypothetical protein [Clostridia bacterium]